MKLTYYFPWGYFHPVRTGAMAVAAQHLKYFRSRGIRPRIIVLADDTAAERNEFERHYHWADDVSVIGARRYPEIQRHFSRWSFSGYLAGHAALAQVPEFREVLARPADVVMLNYVFSSSLLDACTNAKYRVLETYDILSRQFLYPDRSPAAVQYQLKTEFELYGLYDLVIMLNREEGDLARQRSTARIEYAPRPVDVADSQTPGAGGEKYDLLFVGCQFSPNVEGIRWFYDHVFRPYLKCRGIRWAIAGDVCAATDIQDSAVALLGRVDDLNQLYRETKVAIVPLFNGTGTSIKTLEALGQGKPVVTTPCGRRGLDGADDCLVCLTFEKDPAAVADQILGFCRSAELRDEYGRRGMEYIREHFSTQAYGACMDQLLGSLNCDLVRSAA